MSEGNKTVELELIPVLIDRNRDKLHVQVPEHEIAVLEACNIEGAVNRVPGVTEYVLESFDADAGAEYARMVRKYDRRNADNPVKAVYRSPRELERFGFVSTGRAVEKAPQASVVDRRKKSSKTKAEAKK